MHTFYIYANVIWAVQRPLCPTSEQKDDSIIEAGHLFLENRTSIVYLCNEIKKSIKEGVDQFGWS